MKNSLRQTSVVIQLAEHAERTKLKSVRQVVIRRAKHSIVENSRSLQHHLRR